MSTPLALGMLPPYTGAMAASADGVLHTHACYIRCSVSVHAPTSFMARRWALTTTMQGLLKSSQRLVSCIRAGLELFFLDPAIRSDGWGAPSAFLAFRERMTREAVLEALTSAPALGCALPGGAPIVAACASILQVMPHDP